VGRYYRGFLQTAEEMMMLQLEDIFLAEPVLVPVFVHSKTGLLGEEPGLDGSLLVEECRSGGGLGQPYSSQSRFLCKMTIVYTHKIKRVTSRKEINLLSLAPIGPLVLMVNSAKVGNDYGDGKGDDQHTAQRAHAAHHFAGYCLGYHVTISMH